MDSQFIVEYAELAKRLNVTETARFLNMSQPTLSKHITALEKTLRFQLFERSPTGLKLTRAGIDLLPFAYDLIEKQQAFEARAKELRANPLRRLSVGGVVNEEAATEAMARLIGTMSPTYGANFLELKASHHKTSIAMIEEGIADIVFDFCEEKDLMDVDNVDCVPVCNIPLAILVSKANPLANRETVAIDDLRDYTLIKMEGAHMAHGWSCIERMCKSHGFEPTYRRQYSMRQIDLLTIAANLGSDIMVLGMNYIKRIGSGSALFAKVVPIADEDAYIPLSALFHMNNGNPILQEALDLIAATDKSHTYDYAPEDGPIFK